MAARILVFWTGPGAEQRRRERLEMQRGRDEDCAGVCSCRAALDRAKLLEFGHLGTESYCCDFDVGPWA